MRAGPPSFSSNGITPSFCNWVEGNQEGVSDGGSQGVGMRYNWVKGNQEGVSDGGSQGVGMRYNWVEGNQEGVSDE